MAASDVKDLDAQELERVGQAIHASQMHPERRRQVEKSLKRKLDLRCSIFVLMYIMNYLDRNNLGAARLKGLEADLGLDNTQYATCLSICEYTASSARIYEADRLQYM
jgi:sugar phosphate permease